MPSVVSHVSAADGTSILVRDWRDERGRRAGRPWASVLLVHGLGEHSGRYEHVGDQMTAAGLDVHAYDHRGNGGSGGRRGHVDRWEQYHDDLAERLAGRPRGSRAAVPWCSMATRWVASSSSATSDGPSETGPGRALVAGASTRRWRGGRRRSHRPCRRVVPTLAIPNGIDGRTLSRDPSVAARSSADPLATEVEYHAFRRRGARRTGTGPRRDFGGLTLPTLVLHGLDDGLVPPQASEILATLPNVERRTYPGLRHELHNEPEGPAIVDEIIAWIRAKAGGRATIPA